ncbi:MAG: hypothetical protein SV062_13900 [Thermodesulfobacteriota bacterium]|nr:hypothetical protein [Thermodesulfobacteriota bacterium]
MLKAIHPQLKILHEYDLLRGYGGGFPLPEYLDQGYTTFLTGMGMAVPASSR